MNFGPPYNLGRCQEDYIATEAYSMSAVGDGNPFDPSNPVNPERGFGHAPGKRKVAIECCRMGQWVFIHIGSTFMPLAWDYNPTMPVDEGGMDDYIHFEARIPKAYLRKDETSITFYVPICSWNREKDVYIKGDTHTSLGRLTISPLGEVTISGPITSEYDKYTTITTTLNKRPYIGAKDINIFYRIDKSEDYLLSNTDLPDEGEYFDSDGDPKKWNNISHPYGEYFKGREGLEYKAEETPSGGFVVKWTNMQSGLQLPDEVYDANGNKVET